MKLTHSKTILFPDDDMFKEVINFYHNVIGLDCINELNKFRVEFDTGSSRICIHHNNRYDEVDDGHPKRHHIVLTTGDKEGIVRKHKELQKMGYIASETFFPEAGHELGCLFVTPEDIVVFLIKDPMGNGVQIEEIKEDV